MRFWINRAPKIYKSQPYAHNCIGFGSDAPTKTAAGNPTAFLVHKGKKETQRLSNKLADATRVMVKKNWTTIYIKAVPTGDKSAVRFYYTDKNGQVYNGQVIRNTGLSKGKYMTGSLRQVEALQELVNHLQQNGQEVPSSIDLIITQGGYRTKTIFNYGEDTSNLPAYQQQYEQQNFPTMK